MNNFVLVAVVTYWGGQEARVSLRTFEKEGDDLGSVPSIVNNDEARTEIIFLGFSPQPISIDWSENEFPLEKFSPEDQKKFRGGVHDFGLVLAKWVLAQNQ